MEPRDAFAASAKVSSEVCLEPDMPLPVVVLPAAVVVPIPARVIPVIDEWGCDTCVINEVCELIKAMPHPWSAYHAFDAASARFPNIDRAALRMTVMEVLMGQRRCVNRLTTAGLANGPRRDEDGAAYIELNNGCANEYRYSY